MDVGTFLRLKRQDKDLTQREVADAVGVSEGTVSRWESGKIGNMRRDKIEALAKVLSIDPVILTTCKNSTVFGSLEETEEIIRKYSSPFIPDIDDSKASAKANIAGSVTTGLALGAAGAATAAVAGASAAPIATALAGLATAAKALSTLVATSPAKAPDVTQGQAKTQTDWTEEEYQLVEDYRAISETDKKVIRSMIRSLKEKNTVTNSDGNNEEA